MKRKNTPPGDDYRIRCPRLGHQIYFSYCRTENNGLPCAKVLGCWNDHFLVEAFLTEELSHDEWEKAFNGPGKQKIATLVELIEQAKNRAKTDPQSNC